MRYAAGMLVTLLTAFLFAAPASPALKPPPGATAFCDGRVYPAKTPEREGRHISWSAHATDTPMKKVVARYRRKLGKKTYEATPDEHTWRFPSKDAPRRILSVHKAGASGPWTRCALPKSAVTIVLISEI